MPALISWVNWLDRPETVITASSEAPPLLVTRLAEPPLRRRWRTLSGNTSPVLDVDLGRQREVGVLALAQPDDAGGVDAAGEPRGWMASTDTVRHRLDATTAGSGVLLDTGAQAGGWERGYGIHTLRLDAARQARYWRVNLSAPSLATTPAYIDLGRAWLGPAWQPSRGGIAYGWSRAWEDGSAVTTNARSGLDFVDAGPRRRALTFAFNAMSGDDARQIDELQRIAGKSGQVLFIPFPGVATPQARPVIGRLTEVPPISQPNFATYQVAFQISSSV